MANNSNGPTIHHILCHCYLYPIPQLKAVIVNQERTDETYWSQCVIQQTSMRFVVPAVRQQHTWPEHPYQLSRSAAVAHHQMLSPLQYKQINNNQLTSIYTNKLKLAIMINLANYYINDSILYNTLLKFCMFCRIFLQRASQTSGANFQNLAYFWSCGEISRQSANRREKCSKL